MILQDTYYLRFKSELERKAAEQLWSKNPFYIGHYKYERDNAHLAGPDFMLTITLGNYVSRSSKVFGEHTPVPIMGRGHEEEAQPDDGY